MKTFKQWYEQDAWPAVKELPEVAVRAIFEAGQDNPNIERMRKFTTTVQGVNKNFAQYHINKIWEQSK